MLSGYSSREEPGIAAFTRFIPGAVKDADISGLRPSFKAILALIDTDSPDWPAVAAVLREMQTADVEITAPVITAARKLGAQRWSDRQRSSTSEAEPKVAAAPLSLASGCASIVYYIRRRDLIKIGTTTNPVSRFGDLLPDRILAVEPGGQPEEHQRHMQFHHLRQFREYFRIAEELMAHIEAVRKLHGDPDASWPTWTMATTPGFSADCDRESAEIITAAEAEHRYGIKAVTIRALVHRGHIQPVGKKGRASLFFADELRARCA